ncbi:MAG: acetyl-CoA acetyltransferase [Thermodesulfobacteriota bacterium]
MAESIKDKVAIIGMGCTKFGENWEWSVEDMVVDAVYEAYEDAGVGPEAIEAAWVGTAYSGAGGSLLGDIIKLHDIPITRVENFCATGMEAFRNACYAVAAGVYDTVLAVGVEKLKDSGLQGLPDSMPRPVFGVGRTAPGSFALIASRYFAKYGIGKETLAKIAVKNHRNGALNPKAHFQREITIEQVLKAPIIAWPLGLFDCCPTTDGAAAAIITRKNLAQKIRPDYIPVKALALSVSSMWPQFRPGFDYLGFSANVTAAQSAYQQAGIKDPLKELDIAEVHDCFTITELIIYEDLGFCPRGEAKRFIDEGVFELSGELPVNTDGGLKSFGHPIGASGLRMIYEVYKQLQGKAGRRQVKNPKLGLAHNLGGTPQVCCITILGLP